MAGHVKKPKEDKNKKPIVVADLADGFEEVTEKSEQFTADCYALTISPKKDGKFEIIRIEVDSVNKTLGKIEVVDTADGKFEANEKFKINVVNNGIL